jgi:uncharacterized protein (DUF2147 family)
MVVAHSKKLGLFSLITCVALQLANLTSAEEPKGATPADQLIGEWWTENNEGRIQMARYKDGTYRGVTTCCEQKDENGKVKLDIHNPNPALRNRSTVGIVLIWNLKYENGEYIDGHVYNPRDGKTYRMKMEIIDHDTLKIRGYLGFSLLGQTQIWKRAKLTK